MSPALNLRGRTNLLLALRDMLKAVPEFSLNFALNPIGHALRKFLVWEICVRCGAILAMKANRCSEVRFSVRPWVLVNHLRIQLKVAFFAERDWLAERFVTDHFPSPLQSEKNVGTIIHPRRAIIRSILTVYASRIYSTHPKALPQLERSSSNRVSTTALRFLREPLTEKAGGPRWLSQRPYLIAFQ